MIMTVFCWFWMLFICFVLQMTWGWYVGATILCALIIAPFFIDGF